MNNLTESNAVEGTNTFKENEKEVVIDIEEREENDKNVKDVYQINPEKKDNFGNIECGKNFEYGTERKPPEIWIQYNQGMDRKKRI